MDKVSSSQRRQGLAAGTTLQVTSTSKRGKEIAEKIIEQVAVASQLLEALSADIYTPSLRQLKESSQDLQAVAKSSGAGGGDCGIALSFDEQSTETLKNRWANLGIELLYQERMGHDDKS